MASVGDIGMSALINTLSALGFLVAFAVLRIQPINDRVYFPKWYVEGKRRSSGRSWVNLDIKTYLTFLNWMPQSLKMTQSQIITHAGLDSAVFLRIYTLGLKIFGPTAVVVLIVLIPVNVSGGTLFFLSKDLVVSDVDKLSISNISPKSSKFFVHIAMEFLFTFWTCFVLYKEYDQVASMRLQFLASQSTKAGQFTVIVRNVPHESGRSISDSVESFFKKNHPNHYLCHQAVYNANKFAKLARKRNRLINRLDYNQLKLEIYPHKRPTTKTGFLGLWGKKVDSIEYYKHQIEEIDKVLTMERGDILKDPDAIIPAAFVSFNSRSGAAVCAQTQQSKNPTLWLTDPAPEPRDVYWKNLSISFVSLSIRRLLIGISLFALVFFYMIPIAFVQSLANLEGLEKVAPFLKPLIEWKVIKSFLQGFLPGLALKIFMYVLPSILMIMSKIEGHVALSVLERRTAAKYYYFMLVNVFLGSIIAGTAFQQLHAFLHQSATQIPRNIGVSIPMKATFFITYIMVDGWAGIACEILRLKPLVIFHLKNMFLVKTERDRERATEPGSIDFPETLPTLQLYFLLGIVYAVVTPILLPFILVFFAFAYLVYRHQVINVYNQRYESGAAFWPHVHGRIIASLLISQLLLLGLLSTKKAANSTPLLVLLPILTLTFHKYCKNRFEPAFRRYPLEEAVDKDMQDHPETSVELRALLADAYLHPIFTSFMEDKEMAEVKIGKKQEETYEISQSPVNDPPSREEEDQEVQHYEAEPPPGDVFYCPSENQASQSGYMYHYDDVESHCHAYHDHHHHHYCY